MMLNRLAVWTLSAWALTLSLACGTSPSVTQPSTKDAGSKDSAGLEAGTDAGDASIATDAPDALPRPAVTTACGPVVGTATAGVRSFLGIPYAAPPTGDLRFRPPAAPTCWTTPRDASEYGAYCPQSPNLLLPLTGPTAEDCLFVNVWAPDPMPKTPVPVMVWIYGGGFTIGAASDPLYVGAKLAAQGVVVVSMNYRLGALGWLAHPALAAEDSHGSSGNYGILDQLAALDWVQKNVGAFGGDPSHVTIFGESAGGISVCALLGSPLADGLYQGAIIESGSCTPGGAFANNAQPTTVEAEVSGDEFAVKLGCATGDVASCLRSQTVAEILAAQPAFDLAADQSPYAPLVDGYVLPAPTYARLMDPSFTPVPLIVGTNHDEGTLFTTGLTITTDVEYSAAVTVFAGPYAASLLLIYPATDYASPMDAFDAMLRDVVFTCPARTLARLVSTRQPRTYRYQFSQVNAALAALGLGATHASEIPYVWGNFARPFTAPSPVDLTVYAEMSAYWVRFATSGGDPNGGSAETWPEFTTSGDVDLEIEASTTTATGLRASQCDALDALP